MDERQEDSGCGCQPPDPRQRRKLGTMLVVALAPLVPAVRAAEGTGSNTGTKPRAGLRLAVAMGERAGQEVKPADVVLGQDPVLAYPMDAGGKVLESRINLLAIVRVPEADLAPEVKPHAPQGIVAYSAVCTHYGCPVTKTDAARNSLVCNCHGSAFDACKRGVVVQGPATRRLPMLPLTLQGASLVINGGFDGPLGPPTS